MLIESNVLIEKIQKDITAFTSNRLFLAFCMNAHVTALENVLDMIQMMIEKQSQQKSEVKKSES